MPLSDAAVRTAKPKEKPYKITDSGGLFLLVTPSGGNAPEKAELRRPQDIIDDMLARDAETAEILETIRGLL